MSTIVDYSRPMPTGFTVADPFGVTRRADRCDGSLQRTIADAPGAPCPVCRATVSIVPIDGLPHLVEHKPRRDDALPIGLFG